MKTAAATKTKARRWARRVCVVEDCFYFMIAMIDLLMDFPFDFFFASSSLL